MEPPVRSSSPPPSERSTPTRAAGLTIVESVLATTLFSLLMVAFSQAVDLTRSEGGVSEEICALSVDVHEALLAIGRDLRNSTFTTNGIYPRLLARQELADEGWGNGLPNPSSVSAEALRGILFVLPADDDGDGRPDVTVGGDVIWDAREFGYLLVPDAAGSNQLERWVDGSYDRVLCRGVESLTVDSSATAPGVVPVACMRVRLVLAGDARGTTISRQGELTVRVGLEGV